MDKFIKPGVLSQNTIEHKKQKTKRMSPWAVASAIWSKDHVSDDDITASGVSPYIIYTVAAQYNSAPLAYHCMQRLGANIDGKTLFNLFVDIMPWEWPVITPKGGIAHKLPDDLIKIAAFNKVGLNTVREWLFYNIFNEDENMQTKSWELKYRPTNIDDIIMSDDDKAALKAAIASGGGANMMLVGSPGTGKTTAARIIAKAINADVLEINASMDNGIDIMRTKIMDFGTTGSIRGQRKLVILDEADNLTQSAQMALRGVMTQLEHITFILTANYIELISEPIQSRCSILKFGGQYNQNAIAERLAYILEAENVTYGVRTVQTIADAFKSNMRSAINTIQSNVIIDEHGNRSLPLTINALNAIDKGIIETIGELNTRSLFKWAFETPLIDVPAICHDVMRFIKENQSLSTSTIVNLIAVADYAQKSYTKAISQQLAKTSLILSIKNELDSQQAAID